MKTFVSLMFCLIASSAYACGDHDLPNPSSSVQIVGTTVSTSKTDGTVFVTVLGSFKNITESKIDGLMVEAKLTDSRGKVIDVLSEPIYGLVVPAGQQVAFRLQGRAAAKEGAYAGVQVRVVSAEAHARSAPRAAKQEANPFVDFLISWGPMILLIAVWILLARKYNGKGSTQAKMLAAINEQNSLLTKQISAIEAIASAASSRKAAGDA
jgi:ATP-dependent Zn protease